MKKPAVLLIGPTGSGKTPLGNYISRHGLWNKTFAHFDFGELLRQTAAKKRQCKMSTTDLTLLKTILDSGALLEKDTFYLAEKIIAQFNESTDAEFILLNGLPRHVQQAEDVAPHFDIQFVIHLRCTAEVVLERILSNKGKDRTDRTDDSLDLVKKKLEIFATRTTPLISYFENLGAKIVDIGIHPNSQPATLVEDIQRSQK